MRRKIILTLIRQHKAFYCYLLLSLWIFLMVIGLYRYLGVTTPETAYRIPLSEKINTPHPQPWTNVWTSGQKFHKIVRSCSPTESISVGAEGKAPSGYSLEGIVVIFRHGDRGPINHVRNLDSINCKFKEDGNITKVFEEFMSFISTQWSNQMTNNLYHYYTQQNYHPPVPRINECEIGQLTFLGVAQHLKLGQIVRNIYFNRLIGNSTQIQNNIFTYTTKYRRTFQSLNAFLYGFLKDQFHKINLYIANSMYFCFEDCACPVREQYNRAVIAENMARLKSHPAISKVVEEIASIVYTMSDGNFAKDPFYIKDALLTYICHNTPLPCDMSNCIQPSQITRVFSFIDWDVRQSAKSISRHKLSILNAYGFIRSITSHLLKIVSNEKPRIVLYSTHDKTLQHLLTAMGITTNDSVSPPYASRVILEVHASKQTDSMPTKKFYFRIVFNGKDITHRLKFCNNKIPVSSTKNNSRSILCSFESLVRFLHDDYFSEFSAANFKEACALGRN